MIAAYGGKELFVTRAHHFLPVNSADKGVLLQVVVPLESGANLLRRNMLDVSQGFTAAVRLDGRKCLVITFHLPVYPRHERIMITDGGVDSRNRHSDTRTVSLHRCAIVSGLIKERAAQERTSCLGYLVTEASVNCCVPGIGVDVDQSTLRRSNQGVTFSARHIDARLEIPARDLGAAPR